jgi:Leucine-rich repeat (LRR) protein
MTVCNLTLAQTLIEIPIDSAGRKRIIHTNRPDTLSKNKQSSRLEAPQVPVQNSFSEEPVFKSKNDSLKYTTAQLVIRQMMEGKNFNAQKLDSLLVTIQKLRANSIIGYRKIYSPHSTFFSFDSLSTKPNRTGITKLSISTKHYRKISREILACKNLEELELVNTSIQKIPKSLQKLPQLKTISVYNNLSKRPLKLGKNKNIKKLIIRGDHPELIPINYAKLPNLNNLDLADNEMTAFPRGTSKNKFLKELNLSSNKLTLTKDKIRMHSSLEKLDLGKNKISEIPNSIQFFPVLKALTCNHNAIAKVNVAIARLQKLEELSFYSNQLVAIPKGVYQLPNLREIDLYYNQIEKVDSAVANWHKLEVLYLANNKVFSLPESLGELHQLQALYLHNNRISSLPESIGNLNQLKVLRINNNLLTLLPSSVSKLILLENLDVSNNSLYTLPDGFINKAPLKILALVSNPWDAETKVKLSNLTKLLREKGTIVHLNSFDESQ